MPGGALRGRGTFRLPVSSGVGPGGRAGGRSRVRLPRCWGRRRPLAACRCLLSDSRGARGPRALSSILHRGTCPLPHCPGASGAPRRAGGPGRPGAGPRGGRQLSLCPQLPRGLRRQRPPCASSSLRIWGQRQKRGDAEQGWPRPAPRSRQLRARGRALGRRAEGPRPAVPVRQRCPVVVPRRAQGTAVPGVEPVAVPGAGQSRTQHSTITAERAERAASTGLGGRDPALGTGTAPREQAGGSVPTGQTLGIERPLPGASGRRGGLSPPLAGLRLHGPLGLRLGLAGASAPRPSRRPAPCAPGTPRPSPPRSGPGDTRAATAHPPTHPRPGTTGERSPARARCRHRRRPRSSPGCTGPAAAASPQPPPRARHPSPRDPPRPCLPCPQPARPRSGPGRRQRRARRSPAAARSRGNRGERSRNGSLGHSMALPALPRRQEAPARPRCGGAEAPGSRSPRPGPAPPAPVPAPPLHSPPPPRTPGTLRPGGASGRADRSSASAERRLRDPRGSPARPRTPERGWAGGGGVGTAARHRVPGTRHPSPRCAGARGEPGAATLPAPASHPHASHGFIPKKTAVRDCQGSALGAGDSTSTAGAPRDGSAATVIPAPKPALKPPR